MKFDYQGVARSGARTTGVIEADSIQDAKAELKKQGVLVSSVKPASTSISEWLPGAGPSFEDFEFITSELSMLLENGVNIDKALAIIGRAKQHSSAGKVIQTISAKINKGEQLSQAFAAYPEHFDKLYINLIRIGEETATLPAVFRGLAENMHFKVQLKNKIKQAITYPAVILMVCIVAVLFIFNFVVPNMAGMFQGREDIPAYTALILATSEWLLAYQSLLFVSLLAGAMLAFYYRKEWRLQERLVDVLPRLPLIKGFFVLSERIKFCSGVVLMLNAGIKIDNAVALACGNVLSKTLQSEIQYALNQLKQGTGLQSALSHSSLFPDFYLSLLEVGEQSGKLGSVFVDIRDRSRQEFESDVTRFMNLLEPLMILVMGAIVGSVVVSLMLSSVGVNDVGL